MKKDMNQLAADIHQNAKDKGFYDNGAAQNMGERLALIHSEVSEALEADRNGQYCTDESLHNVMLNIDSVDFPYVYKKHVKGSFEEEMADIVIRVFDMCALKKIDIEAHIKAKMMYNSWRPKMHGGKKY